MTTKPSSNGIKLIDIGYLFYLFNFLLILRSDAKKNNSFRLNSQLHNIIICYIPILNSGPFDLYFIVNRIIIVLL